MRDAYDEMFSFGDEDDEISTYPTKISEFGTELKQWQPIKLGPRHKMVLALHSAGLKNPEIAVLVGYSEQRVSTIITHPDAQGIIAQLTTEHIAGLTSDVAQMVQGAAPEAFMKVVTLMRSAKSETVQKDCAMDILDRAGFTAKTTNAPPPMNFPSDGVERITKALGEAFGEVKQPKEVLSVSEALPTVVNDPDYEVV